MTLLSVDAKLGYSDVVTNATREVLLGSSVLNGWTSGRIYRAHVLTPLTGRNKPYGVVAALAESSEHGIGHEELTITVGVAWYYTVPHQVLSETEVSVGAVFDETRATLISNPYLKVPQTGDIPLVKRPPVFETLNLADVHAGSLVDHYLAMTASFVAKSNFWKDTPTWTSITE